MTANQFNDEFQTYMLVVAHPDDSEFSSGGTVIQLAEAGKRVVLIQVTSGDKGSPDATVAPVVLAATREAEMLEAAANLEFERAASLRDKVARLKSLPASGGALAVDPLQEDAPVRQTKAGMPGTRAGRKRRGR